MALAEEIAAMHGGSGHPGRLLGEFRRSLLLAPLSEGADGSGGADAGLMSGWHGGVRWIYAFDDEAALARFAAARGAGEREWEYLAILGARLVDEVIPGIEGPTGVAVNVADEGGSMLFPPVVGIVPDAQAVDAAPGRGDAA